MKTEDQSRLKTGSKVYKVEWWWDASSDNLSNYNDNATTSYKLYNHTDASGKGNVRFALTDEEWGRYMIRVLMLLADTQRF
jgi:hypothetical protein